MTITNSNVEEPAVRGKQLPEVYASHAASLLRSKHTLKVGENITDSSVTTMLCVVSELLRQVEDIPANKINFSVVKEPVRRCLIVFNNKKYIKTHCI